MKLEAWLLCVALSCVSCSTLPFGGLSSAELEQELRSRPLVFSDEDLAEIEAIQPQLPTPFRLGIAPPLSRDRGDRSIGTVGTWTKGEQALIRKWARKLEQSGSVSQVVFLPNALVGGSTTRAAGDFVSRVRAAGVRSHVDCVLIVNSLSSVHRSNNALALLDLTIVGAAIFPGHAVHAETVSEALMIDARNNYLYATAMGAGEAERSSAAFFIDEKISAVMATSRLEALDSLARDLSSSVSNVEFRARPRDVLAR